MDCAICNSKICRTTQSCGAEKFDAAKVTATYLQPENQHMIQAAADLVDNGRAGTLSRFQEIIAFVEQMKYQKVGLAYCFGMEEEAKLVRKAFRQKGMKITTVSCAVGGFAQDSINTSSCIHKVSCNPIGQARQLEAEKTDFVIVMGICLGHDILLQKNLKADFTTFVVKDRVHQHNPLAELAVAHVQN
jgi:uncharacterized metal-binding protein